MVLTALSLYRGLYCNGIDRESIQLLSKTNHCLDQYSDHWLILAFTLSHSALRLWISAEPVKSCCMNSNSNLASLWAKPWLASTFTDLTCKENTVLIFPKFTEQAWASTRHQKIISISLSSAAMHKTKVCANKTLNWDQCSTSTHLMCAIKYSHIHVVQLKWMCTSL